MCCPAPVLNKIPAGKPDGKLAPRASPTRSRGKARALSPLSPRTLRRVSVSTARPALTVGAALLELLPRPLLSLYFRHGGAAPHRTHVRPPRDGTRTAAPVGQRGRSASPRRYGGRAGAEGRSRAAAACRLVLGGGRSSAGRGHRAVRPVRALPSSLVLTTR